MISGHTKNLNATQSYREQILKWQRSIASAMLVVLVVTLTIGAEDSDKTLLELTKEDCVEIHHYVYNEKYKAELSGHLRKLEIFAEGGYGLGHAKKEMAQTERLLEAYSDIFQGKLKIRADLLGAICSARQRLYGDAIGYLRSADSLVGNAKSEENRSVLFNITLMYINSSNKTISNIKIKDKHWLQSVAPSAYLAELIKNSGAEYVLTDSDWATMHAEWIEEAEKLLHRYTEIYGKGSEGSMYLKTMFLLSKGYLNRADKVAASNNFRDAVDCLQKLLQENSSKKLRSFQLKWLAGKVRLLTSIIEEAEVSVPENCYEDLLNLSRANLTLACAAREVEDEIAPIRLSGLIDVLTDLASHSVCVYGTHDPVEGLIEVYLYGQRERVELSIGEKDYEKALRDSSQAIARISLSINPFVEDQIRGDIVKIMGLDPAEVDEGNRDVYQKFSIWYNWGTDTANVPTWIAHDKVKGNERKRRWPRGTKIENVYENDNVQLNAVEWRIAEKLGESAAKRASSNVSYIESAAGPKTYIYNFAITPLEEGSINLIAYTATIKN